MTPDMQYAVLTAAIPATVLAARNDVVRLFRLPAGAVLLDFAMTPTEMDVNACPTLEFQCRLQRGAGDELRDAIRVARGEPAECVVVTGKQLVQMDGLTTTLLPEMRGFQCGDMDLCWVTTVPAATAVPGTVHVGVRWLEESTNGV